MSNKKTTFNAAWLSIEKFKSWVKVDKECPHSFYCVLCKKSASLSNMGVQSLTSHMNSKKHKSRVTSSGSAKTLTNFKINKNDNQVTSELSEMSPILTPKTIIQKSLSTMVERDQNTKAEIIWGLHVISSHISMSAGGKSILAMKNMFVDSDIAKNINL